MRLPRPGSNARTIVDAIYRHGPLTIDRGIEVHRLLGLSICRTHTIYATAERFGHIAQLDGVYSISPAAIRLLDLQHREVAPTSIPTPSRQINNFSKPMTGYAASLSRYVGRA